MILRPFKKIREQEEIIYNLKRELDKYKEKERRQKENENMHNTSSTCIGCTNLINTGWGLYCKLDCKCEDRKEDE